MFFNFREHGNRAVERSREQRTKEADEMNRRAEESFLSNSEIQQARTLKEQESLQELKEFCFVDPPIEKYVSFGKDIEDACDWVSAKSGEGDSSEMDKENEDNSLFEGELLSEGDKVVDLENFELSDLGGVMSDEDWDKYELAESDKFLMKNLIKNYAGI